jgi:hypothetical protein
MIVSNWFAFLDLVQYYAGGDLDWFCFTLGVFCHLSSPPELPPSFFLDLLFAGDGFAQFHGFIPTIVCYLSFPLM